MDVQVTSEVLGHTGLSEGELDEPESPGTAGATRKSIAWESILRCAFLTAVFSLIGVLAWRPGLLRFSILMSLANPSRGESLNWKPTDEPPPPLPERKGIHSPAEWRLGQGYSAAWIANRPPAQERETRAGRFAGTPWRRYSTNPWRWQNDAGTRKIRSDIDAPPAQKPASSFRVGDLAAWPESSMSIPLASGSSIPPLEGLPPLPPALPAAPAASTGFLPPLSASPMTDPAPTTAQAPLPRASATGSSFMDLPALPVPLASSADDSPLRPPEMPTPTRAGQSAFAAAAEPGTSQRAPEGSASQALMATSETVPPVSGETDWKNHEIIGPIAGAYLTIYPKLRFVGLCVPGQGYIRKYNQVGVPRDLNSPKETAQDGRTPYGKYYVAARSREADGPHLFLSWPSIDDAKRLGFDAGRLLEIESSWQRKALPPQDTSAGGGVGLDGLRGSLDRTDGGFSLEPPHMEEIFTALPDGAWVFVQP